MVRMKEIMPCAKCGGEAILFVSQSGIQEIKCKKCGFWIRQRFWNEERLIEVWNTWYREDGEA